MKISVPYAPYFEDRLLGRYVALQHIENLLNGYRDVYEISSIGTSVQGAKIHCVKIGHGNKRVLAWSQMHGNESTTTKVLFDLFKFFHNPGEFQLKASQFLSTHTLYCIPMLNPDGAANYTRENANGTDLNRDALELTQPESKALATLFETVQPQLCLNLHGQRTLYSLPGRQCATVSFLSPSANEAMEVTPTRRVAMEDIVKMTEALQTLIPGKIGRYDDAFNPNCVGDRFQMAGVPTILFEAGHYPEDYGRSKSREAIFYAFLSLFGCLEQNSKPRAEAYFDIPENEKKFRDVLLRNVVVGESDPKMLAINYAEVLENGKIRLQPLVESFGDSEELFGHEEIDVEGASILLNCYENVFEGEKVSTIVDKSSTNRIFYKDSCNII